MSHEDRKFDLRTLDRYIQRGIITREEYEKHLEELEDLTDQGVPLRTTLEQVELEAKQVLEQSHLDDDDLDENDELDDVEDDEEEEEAEEVEEKPAAKIPLPTRKSVGVKKGRRQEVVEEDEDDDFDDEDELDDEFEDEEE